MNTALAADDSSRVPHALGWTLSHAIELTGFAFTLFAAISWVQPLVQIGELSVALLWILAGALCLLLAILKLVLQWRASRTPNKKSSISRPSVQWMIGWGVTAIVGAFPHVLDQHGATAFGVALLLLLLAAIIAWRLHPIPYALAAIGFGTWVGVYCGKATYGVAATLAIGLAMAISNYLFLLVTEHWEDAKRVAARFKWRHRQASDISAWQLLKALYYFWPAAAIVAVGIVLHDAAQDWIELRFYEDAMLDYERAPDGTPLDQILPPDRDLGLDALYTLENRKQKDLSALTHYVNTAYGRITQETDRTPEKVRAVLKENQPPAISNKPCDKFRVRVLRKTITFRSPCREAIGDMNNRVRKRYDALEAKIDQQVSGAAFATAEQARTSRESTLTEGRIAIEREYAAYVLFVHRSMQAAFWAQLVGCVAIVAAVLAGLLAAVGRVTFDTQTGGLFRLTDDAPRPLLITRSKAVDDIPVLDLKDLKVGRDGVTRSVWYRSHHVSCDAPQHLKTPQCTQSILQRVLTGRYLLSRIDLAATTTKKVWWKNTAIKRQTSHAFDFKLVKVAQGKLIAIELQPTQEIVFRMRSLVAFSEDLNLRSTYSTRVAANCLGLGNFQSTACGPGVLVLASHGTIAPIKVAGRDPIALLVWDRGVSFTLVQAKLGALSLILNSPNVAPVETNDSDESESAIIDQQVTPPRFWRKIWNLVRYIIVPF